MLVVMAKGFKRLVGLVVALSVGLTSIATEAKTAAKPDVFPPVVLELPKFSNAIEEAQASSPGKRAKPPRSAP
jgi:hypothetical protein